MNNQIEILEDTIAQLFRAREQLAELLDEMLDSSEEEVTLAITAMTMLSIKAALESGVSKDEFLHSVGYCWDAIIKERDM